MAALALRRRAPSRAFWIAPLILVAQIALGAINVWAGKHAGLIVGHLLLGTTLWATVVYADRDPAARLRPGARARRLAGHDRSRDRLMESATTSIGLARERSLAETVRDYITLTKPRIISLLLLTTVATMIVAKGSFPPSSRPCSGRCSAATSRPAAPGRSTTTSTASATRAWPAPAGGRWSRAGSSRPTGSPSGSRSAPWRRSSWR